jgi:hypothetical protein
MNQYQIRGYNGWHRYMAMTSMAMLFLQTEKSLYMEQDALPTTAQIAQII